MKIKPKVKNFKSSEPAGTWAISALWNERRSSFFSSLVEERTSVKNAQIMTKAQFWRTNSTNEAEMLLQIQ